MTTYSISYTNGLFNDQTSQSVQFMAAWEEEKKPPPNENPPKKGNHSSLTFISEGGSCTGVFASIQNGKNDMKEQISYEIYFHKDKGPKLGEVIFSGQVEGIKSKEITEITYSELIQNGKYMFKAYQETTHPGKGELWSGEIIVEDCDLKQTDKEEINVLKPSSVKEEEKEEDQEKQEKVKIEFEDIDEDPTVEVPIDLEEDEATENSNE